MEIKSTIINHKPDGIFVSDDLTAILTMKIAHQLKLNIPEDLKLLDTMVPLSLRNFSHN